MRDTSHLTREQLREAMHKPLSPKAAERARKATEDAGWLLAHNLREMDLEAEPDPTHVSVTPKRDDE